MTFLERAGSWLLFSGIQEPNGGVARYYLSDQGRNAPISTEITGYTASALVYLHSLTSEPAYLRAALRAAQYLVEQGWDKAAKVFPFERPRDGEPELVYFFDSSIIVQALLTVARSTKDNELYRAWQLGCLSMVDAFRPDKAPVPPVLCLPWKTPLPFESRWSRSPGCYQLKAALAWRNVDGLEMLYDRAVEEALHSHDSFLPGDDNCEKVMDRLHAYAYFLEGLLPAVERPECAQALRDGIAQLSHYLREIAPVFERSDVYAQLLRVRLYADNLGVSPLDRMRARQEAEHAASFQASDPDPRVDGGFYFGRKGDALLPFVNPVSTAFCLQALAMWRQYEAGELQVSIDELV